MHEQELSEAEQFTQKISECQRIGELLVDSVISSQEDVEDAFDLSREAILQLSPKESFLYLATLQHQDLITHSREELEKIMQDSREKFDEFKEVFHERYDPALYGEGLASFFESDTPIKDAVESANSDHFFRLIVNIDEEIPGHDLEDALHYMYLDEMGVIEEHLSLTDEERRIQFQRYIEKQIWKRKSVAFSLARMVSNDAIAFMVKDGSLDENHDIEFIDIGDYGDEESIPILHISGKPIDVTLNPSRTLAEIIAHELIYEEEGQMFASKYTRVTMMDFINESSEFGETETKVLDADPSQIGFALNYLDALTESIRQFQESDREKLREKIEDFINS